MRFGENLQNITIPEWKQCYINYQTLKIFIMIIKEIIDTLKDGQKLNKQFINKQPLLDNIMHPQIEQVNKIMQYLKTKLQVMNELFYATYELQEEIADIFYQMKVLQIEQSYQICAKMQYQNAGKTNLPLYLTYIQYAYIQISYLSQMREANVQASRKILKKHKKYAKQLVETPIRNHLMINRLARIEEEYLQKIQDLYVKQNTEMKSKEAREFLRNTMHRSQEDKGMDFFYSGIWIGSSICLLAALIFIIVYMRLSVETASVFARDFPTWRGVAIFILYIWILGANLYFFEKYKISHRLIFKFQDHHFSTSMGLFRTAGTFTTIFLILFLVYLLQINGIVSKWSHFREEYLAIIVWTLIVGFIFFPFPMFNYQGRIYAIKLIGKSLIAPFKGVDFSVIWMTDQWISLSTPLRDLAYSVCYYTKLDFDQLSVNPCKSNSSFQVIALPIVLACTFRILQCIRVGITQGAYFKTRHFVNSLKYSCSIAAALVSYFYNLGFSAMLYIWIVVSIISTTFSYMWDLKMDWDLLQPNQQKNKCLRKYLHFQPKRNYYCIMVLNFIMRLSWMLTISPNIAALFGNSSLLTLVTGCIQIMRRGIWNLLRVQKEHLNNVQEFKAIPDTLELKAKLLQEEKKDEGVHALIMFFPRLVADNMHVQHFIKREFISLICRKIKQRELNQEEYHQEYEDIHIKEVQGKAMELQLIKKKFKKTN